MSIIINKTMAEEKYIKWLITHKKPVEVRLATDEFMNCDYINFICNDSKNRYKFKVVDRTLFNTFEQCVDYYGFKKLICDTKTREECIEKYKSFYPKKQYLKFKIVALKLVWKLQNEE